MARVFGQFDVPGFSAWTSQWVIPDPVQVYQGNISDLEAFTEARDARRRLPSVLTVLDGRTNPHIIGHVRFFAMRIYDAFLQTTQVKDANMKNGKRAQAVQAMEQRHWGYDLLFRASWKVVVSEPIFPQDDFR